MKRYIFPILLILFASTFSDAQAAAQTESTPAAKPKTVEFPREKFDPLRDPAADLADAVTRATADGKRIVLDVGGEWCGWCRYMDKFFYENKDLAAVRDRNYIWVKVNMSQENENKAFLSTYPVISGYPHLFVLEPDGRLLHSQSTDVLEQKDGYDIAKFSQFLNKWAPQKTAKGN